MWAITRVSLVGAALATCLLGAADAQGARLKPLRPLDRRVLTTGSIFERVLREGPGSRLLPATRLALRTQTTHLLDVFRRGNYCSAIGLLHSASREINTATRWRQHAIPPAAAAHLNFGLWQVGRALADSDRIRPCRAVSDPARSVGRNSTGNYLPLVTRLTDLDSERLPPIRRGVLHRPRPGSIANRPISEAVATLFTQLPDYVNTVTDLGRPPDGANNPGEPTVATAGNVVWYTGNSLPGNPASGFAGAGYSLDGGRTFTYLKTSRLMPDNGLPSCCDQIVRYVPQANLFVWVIQYWCVSPDLNCNTVGHENRLRLAWATPEAVAANTVNPGAAWQYVDITPAGNGRTGQWFDRPNMAYGRKHVFLATNAFMPVRQPDGTTPQLCQGSLVVRIALSDLHPGFKPWRYFNDGHCSIVPTSHTGPTMYLATRNSDSQLNIFRWDTLSNNYDTKQASTTTTPTVDWNSSAPDNVVWNTRSQDVRLQSATMHRGLLYVVSNAARRRCTGNCDVPFGRTVGGRTMQTASVLSNPGVQLMGINPGSFFHDDIDRFLSFSDAALMNPAIEGSGAAGRLGLVSAAGGAWGRPRTVVAQLDPGPDRYTAFPAPAADNPQGDYNSIENFGGDFAVAGSSAEADGEHWKYVRWRFG